MSHFTRATASGASPVVRAVFHISFPRFQHLRRVGQSIPDPFVGQALLDTGASVSCIATSIVNHLGLEARGMQSVLTPSTGSVPVDREEYDVGLVIPPDVRPDDPLVQHCLPVVRSDLISQGIHALIGCDVLQGCIFHYNGDGYFSLAW